VKRPIVRINEELCTGCGLCVTPCAEGAIEIVNGKARVIREELCDGAGFCLSVCPTGALSIEEREAPAFDHDAAGQEMARRGPTYIAQTCFMCRSRRAPRRSVTAEKRGSQTRFEQLFPSTETCFMCRSREEQVPLLPCRFQGASLWVCTRCLPRLIHG